MQILIIRIPPGETVTSLSYTIDAEVLIGQGSGCQILLPDRKISVAERHARIFPEDDQWYLENLSSGELMVNATPMLPRKGIPHLLSDGDLIYCGDYCLMASDFSPWQKEPVTTLPASRATVPVDYCPPQSADSLSVDSLSAEGLLPLRGAPLAEHPDDPFLTHEIQQQGSQDDVKQQGAVRFSDFMAELSDTATATSHSVPLIDVLARDSEDEEGDWSISRNLRSSQPKPLAEEQTVTDSPVTGQVPAASGHQRERSQVEAWRPADLLHQQAIIDAILEALELMLADFSPDHLEPLLSLVDDAQQPPDESGTAALPGEGWKGLPGTAGPDFWQGYRHFYHCFMHEKRYRELFLQRLGDALNR